MRGPPPSSPPESHSENHSESHDESLNHPVFQSFASFCLPLANSADGFGDENVKKISKKANLQDGKLNKGAVTSTGPSHNFYAGDVYVGAEILVIGGRDAGDRNKCHVTFNTESMPHAEYFIAWLQGLDSAWVVKSDRSKIKELLEGEVFYRASVRYCKPLSKGLSLRLFYGGEEGLLPPPYSSSVKLSVYDVAEDCP